MLFTSLRSRSSVQRRVLLSAVPGIVFGAASGDAASDGLALEAPPTLRGFQKLPPGVLLPKISLQDAEGAETGTDAVIGQPFMLNATESWVLPHSACSGTFMRRGERGRGGGQSRRDHTWSSSAS
jgi:hypothetical protein